MKDVVEKRAPKRFNHVAQALAADCLALVPSAGAGTTMTWSHSADTDAVASTRGSGVRALDKRALFRCPSLFALSSLSFFFFFFFLLFFPLAVALSLSGRRGKGNTAREKWKLYDGMPGRRQRTRCCLSLSSRPLPCVSYHPIPSDPLPSLTPAPLPVPLFLRVFQS